MSEELKDFSDSTDTDTESICGGRKSTAGSEKEEPLMDENVLSEEERRWQISLQIRSI